MFKGEYLKVLNFRDELINLLNKYDFGLYADNKDNGDMIIDTGRQYIMSDSNRNYSISDVINNNNLIEEYIKETFIGSQQHEFCNGNHSNYYCGIFTNDSYKDGKRCPRTVQKFNLERGLHPTQKPTKLFEYLIKTYTDENDIVVDLCAGSGTTKIACMNSNRNYIVNDKDEKYYNIILRR